MTISNLDLHYLVAEIKPLEGEFLQKVFGQNGLFRFKFRSTDLVARLPEFAFLTQTPPSFSEHPASFIMLLRKRLTGRLQKISQVGFDRILQLHFSDVSVVIELFGEGNLLLLDGAGFILKPWRAEEFAHRKLFSGQKYVAPPQDKAHPKQWNSSVLDAQTGTLIAALSKTVNLSPLYLEEACARAGLDKKMPANSLKQEQKTKIAEALQNLLEQQSSPQIYFEDGKAKTAAPFGLESLRGKEQQHAPTFSQAIQTVFQNSEEQRQTEQAQAAPKAADSRKTVVLEKQRAALESFEQRATEAQKKAEWIYRQFSLIENLRQHSDSQEDTIRPLIPAGLSFKKKRHKIEIEAPDNSV